MPSVISASRRTDIPAFYSDWMVNRLKAGYVYVKNPYSKKFSRVSLQPGDVSSIVFWSKNYSPLLSKLPSIEKTTTNLFFHFTITANRELELNVPDYREAVKDYLFLARNYSANQIIWRYDPICITDKLSFEVHKERFIQCAKLLQGHADKCVISFVHPYKKVTFNFTKHFGQSLLELTMEKKLDYAHQLAETGKKFGIQLYACCNDYLLSENILKASCIDGRYLSDIFKTAIDARPAPTRKECACTKSTDIGTYDTCAHECIYCYANADKEKARAIQHRQDPEWNALGTQVAEEMVASDEAQQSIFK